MKYEVIWLRQDFSLEECRGRIVEIIDKQHYVGSYEDYWSFQCLVEYEESDENNKKLKALEIIKEKQVDVGALCELDLELYNKYVIEINGTPTLTQEEFDLLKEVLLCSTN